MKIFLNQTEVPWAWALKQGLGDPYKLHQWIWGMLPDASNARRDFLFRSDVKGGVLRILLLSERIPSQCGDAECFLFSQGHECAIAGQTQSGHVVPQPS